MSDIVIRMDRSKKFSSVHGDRAPSDPHYRVHHWQDGLPFDVDGKLVADDGKSEPWTVTHDGNPLQHYPLYDENMRRKVAHKVKRIVDAADAAKAGRVLAQEAEAEVEDAGPTIDDVNFESYLRGEVQYDEKLLFKAWKERKFKQHTKIRDLVVDMVEDEKLIPITQVAPYLLRQLAAAGVVVPGASAPSHDAAAA